MNLRKWIWRASVVLIALLPPAAVATANTIDTFADRYAARADTVTVAPAPRPHDPAKPTVAFLVGSKGANGADLLGPFETLASTGQFNTYVVSDGARLVPLTGGLDLVPDLTFDELAALAGTVDAVVVPALQPPDQAELDTITGWLRHQSAAGALTVSVCHGARWLAASGLLDGKTATSHWLRLPALREDFGAVDWVSGKRYVEDGNVLSTAGVLSGLDGGLRIIERLAGQDLARQAARDIGWRHYTPGRSAPLAEASWTPPDAVVMLNASYRPSTIGVRLTEGAGELDLAATFLSYTEQSMVSSTVAVGDGPIRSKHGLTFVPRTTVAAADVDRLLTPGAGDEFAFDPVLRDIASTYDVQTARFAAKTLEYPLEDIELTGPAWPWLTTAVPFGLALLGAAAAIAAGRVFRSFRRQAVQPHLPLEGAGGDGVVVGAERETVSLGGRRAE